MTFIEFLRFLGTEHPLFSALKKKPWIVQVKQRQPQSIDASGTGLFYTMSPRLLRGTQWAQRLLAKPGSIPAKRREGEDQWLDTGRKAA